VKTKTRHVYDVGLGEGHDDDPGNYNEKLKLTSKIKCVHKCQQKLKHNGK
jgi:hypothetical protein